MKSLCTLLKLLESVGVLDLGTIIKTQKEIIDSKTTNYILLVMHIILLHIFKKRIKFYFRKQQMQNLLKNFSCQSKLENIFNLK